MKLRTKKLEKIYREYLKEDFDGSCIFCSKELIVKEYKYWILLQNKFPYDTIAKKHLLLAPKRHIQEQCELSEAEELELVLILGDLEYNMQILNKKKDRSVPEHHHIHLVTLK